MSAAGSKVKPKAPSDGSSGNNGASTVHPRADVSSLEQLEQEQRDFLENAAIAMHRVGEDGTILWANAAELKLLGYSREEYVGHNIVEFHVDEPVIRDILRRLKSGEALQAHEARLRCKDGSVRCVSIHSNVYREAG